MTGALTLRVIPRGDYDFGGAAAGTASVPAAQRVFVERFRIGTLLVRAHLVTLTAPNKILVQVRTAAPTDEEPAVFFRAPATLAEVELAAGALAPGLLPPASWSEGSGQWVSVFVTLVQASGGLWSRAVLSADLVLRDGAPA